MTSSTKIFYLDKEFVSNFYEEITKEPSNTTITRDANGGVQLNAQIFSFSGGASETKSFQISTVMMLKKISNEILKFKNLKDVQIEYEQPSMVIWIDGIMTLGRVSCYEEDNISKIRKLKSEGLCFQILSNEQRFSLLSVNAYFFSGFFGITEWSGNILECMSVPVRALVRVISARTPDDQWIAIPLLILDAE
jgi:hypothetical protein